MVFRFCPLKCEGLRVPPSARLPYLCFHVAHGMSVLDTITTSSAALAANDMRIASLAIVAYEYASSFLRYSFAPENDLSSYILTLPAEWRFYRTFYRSNFRLKCLIMQL